MGANMQSSKFGCSRWLIPRQRPFPFFKFRNKVFREYVAEAKDSGADRVSTAAIISLVPNGRALVLKVRGSRYRRPKGISLYR